MRKTVYWIEGDGIGPDVWKSARPVIDEAIRLSYGDERGFDWKELLAGEKALKETGTLLPDETLAALRGAELAIKGPLGTPVGTGFRSLNVTLRQTLDLYACIRPIRYFEGIESPVKHPERVDMIVFRENTEDVYAGIEYKAGTPEAAKLIAFLRDELGANVDASAAVGVKPMTEKGSKRLVRAAIRHALAQNLPSVTLVHKGNIMKFTEGRVPPARLRCGEGRIRRPDRGRSRSRFRAGQAGHQGPASPTRCSRKPSSAPSSTACSPRPT